MTVPAFELPPALEAEAPPEERGLARDEVRLLVAAAPDGRIAIEHARFRDLESLLRPGDLLVLNVSATLPAALPGRRADGGGSVRVHISTRAPGLGESWRVVELRSADGSRPLPGRVGDRIELAPGHELALEAPYAAGRAERPAPAEAGAGRLLLARHHGAGTVEELLARLGEPIRYGYAARPWPLEAYQNVYAIAPGSAEMPSAGRPFTERLITRLVARGVVLAPIILHCGVSSPERHEPPYPEPYEVPAATARLISATRAAGRRVVAVGTTVVRALETVARPDGLVVPGAGWTNLVLGPARGVRAVDALITGWHEPRASHLDLLAALAGEELVTRSYAAALEHGYRWHEFGDSHLVLAG